MTETTTYDHLAIEADALAERRLHGRVLAAGTFTSVGCNVWHALITGTNGPLGATGAAVIALIAPLCLLVGTHSLLMHLWARNPYATWFDHAIKAFSALIFLGVSACAFAISFHGLRDIAEMSQIMPGIAALFPLMLDGLLVVSGVCLLASVRLQSSAHRAQTSPTLTTDNPAQDTELHHSDLGRDVKASDAEHAPVGPSASMVAHRDRPTLSVLAEEPESVEPETIEPVVVEFEVPEPRIIASAEQPTTDVDDVELPTQLHGTSYTDADRYAALASAIQNGRSDIAPATIAEALRLVDAGLTHREAANVIGVNRSTVTRWCDKAKGVRLDPELITT